MVKRVAFANLFQHIPNVQQVENTKTYAFKGDYINKKRRSQIVNKN
jgi:hypothetical protein